MGPHAKYCFKYEQKMKGINAKHYIFFLKPYNYMVVGGHETNINSILLFLCFAQY